MEFCPPGHKHDALCDPALNQPHVQPNPDVVMEGHRRHMQMVNQDGWLAWQLTRPLDMRNEGKGKRASGVPVKKKRN